MQEQANRIRELREEKKITQVRLSIELEKTQETISAYEIGKHYPSVKSLMQMANLFGASMDYVMGISPVRNPMTEKNLPDDDVKFLQLFRRLSKLQKEKACSYMEGMASEN